MCACILFEKLILEYNQNLYKYQIVFFKLNLNYKTISGEIFKNKIREEYEKLPFMYFVYLLPDQHLATNTTVE